MLTVRLQAV